jgi:hypothetical protein
MKCYIIDLLNNREGSKMMEVKFITWMIGLEITTKYPYLISNVDHRMRFLRFVYIVILSILSIVVH